MLRRDPRFGLLVVLTVAAIAGVLASLVIEIGRPYPGFFFSSDFRVFPVERAARPAGVFVPSGYLRRSVRRSR